MNKIMNNDKNNIKNSEIEQFKQLIKNHSVIENLKILSRQAQELGELANQFRKKLVKITLDQVENVNYEEYSAELEKIRLAKHYMRGIRIVNLHRVLKGEEPSHATTDKFDKDRWMEGLARKEEKRKQFRKEKRANKQPNIINNLYEHFKDSPKQLKIVCDWDEVIQTHEPYALWKLGERQEQRVNFQEFFKHIWDTEGAICYSPYGSYMVLAPNRLEQQNQIKNSLNFYQEAPFLSIAKDLLKLIKEDKVAELCFLTAYDERKFPNGDSRKIEMFKETFRKLGKESSHENKLVVSLQLIPFDSETAQGLNKTDWIKENASDFDLVIDDNPNICRDIVKSLELRQCLKCIEETKKEEEHYLTKLTGVIHPAFCNDCPRKTTLAPHYPAIENQHDERVLLVKQEVSNLTKEDFIKNESHE